MLLLSLGVTSFQVQAPSCNGISTRTLQNVPCMMHRVPDEVAAGHETSWDFRHGHGEGHGHGKSLNP